MAKQDGAFLTIGELAAKLGVPHHILRYWETRFPALRPLQRAGNRRYYRPEDVALAQRIHHLLNKEGYTIRGAQQALSGQNIQAQETGARPSSEMSGAGQDTIPSPSVPPSMSLAEDGEYSGLSPDDQQKIVRKLESIRDRLSRLIEDGGG